MSVKFSITLLKNPLRPDEPAKYYAKAQVREVIDLHQISEEIGYATSLTDGDVYNVLRCLPRKIKEHLSKGDMVDLGDLGRFQYQIKSVGATSREEFTYNNIKKVKFQFRPGKLILDSLDKMSFEEVLPVKVRKAAMKLLKSGGSSQAGNTANEE